MTDMRITDGSLAVLFVCLGNICRSPLAEGIFLHLLEERGIRSCYRVESAGTGGWHVGEPADRRSVEVARRHGIRLEGAARQVSGADFEKFDVILAMDSENLRDLEVARGRGARGADLVLLRAFDPESDGDLDVPDPYYGGPDGFDQIFHMIHRACAALLDTLEERRSP